MSSLTIADHPTDPIVIVCQKCDRNGRYRKATLIEKYGDDTVLPDLLAMLASDCEFRNKLGNQGCGRRQVKLRWRDGIVSLWEECTRPQSP